MIVYRKTLLGLHLLLRVYGSSVLRTAVCGAAAALQTSLLYALCPRHLDQFFQDGRVMVYTIFSTAFALLVIFRQNASYQRFHEARTRLQACTAAWTDAAVKALGFDGGIKAPFQPATAANPDPGAARFRLDMLHYFSLLHGLALQFLRSDWVLENIVEHDGTKLPPWDSANFPNYRPALVDYFMLRAVGHKRQRYNAALPIQVLGPLSSEETGLLTLDGERVHTMSEEEWREVANGGALAPQKLHKLPTQAIRQAHRFMFAHSQGKYVRGAAERVYQVYNWVHERCRQRMVEGGLDVPAPVLATLFTSLQKGLDNFEHCRYLIDTPFPFSWAQLLIVGLLCFQATLPFVVVSAINNWALGISFAVFVTVIFWGLNEVARELEDPFCFEPNDIPLPRLQYQYNERLLAAANTRLPGVDTAGNAAFRRALREVVAKAAAGSLGAPDTMTEDADGAQTLPSSPRTSFVGRRTPRLSFVAVQPPPPPPAAPGGQV